VAIFTVVVSSTPVVASGDPSEGNQDGFPIKNVGNDGEGERSTIYEIWMDSVKTRKQKTTGWVPDDKKLS